MARRGILYVLQYIGRTRRQVIELLNYEKRLSKRAADGIAHAQRVLKEAEADGLLQRPPVKFDDREPGSVEELKYWGGLLKRLGEEGSEDARKLMSDVEAMMEQGEDLGVIANRFIGGLMRYAVLQAYERPLPAGNGENLSIRMPEALLQKVDSAIAAGAARNRSEFIRTVLEMSFSAVDASEVKYAGEMMKILALLMEHPEEALLFYMIRSFFNRPDVGSVAKMLRSIASPLTEIIAAVGGGGIERVKDAVGELFQKLDTPDSQSEESQDAVNNLD